MNFVQLQLAETEYERWLRLVKHLEEMKAVTAEDCMATPTRRDTAGTLLFHLIRTWAHSYADLREANPKVKTNEEIDQ